MKNPVVRTRVIAIGVLAILLIGGTVLADSSPAFYRIEALPALGGTERCPAHSNATGINELGHAVGLAEVGEDVTDPWGNWFDCRFLNHAVIWRDGEIVDLGYLVPDMPLAIGKGINDHDQAVGQSMGPVPPFSGGFGMPFLWTKGYGMINPAAGEIEPPIGRAWGINNAGQVAMSNYRDPYFWDPVEGARRIHFPDDPGPTGGDAWEINNDGVVVGETSRTSDPFQFLHAFKYDSRTDTITDLHDLFYRHSGAYGLNDNGDVGGWTESYTDHVFAKLWKDDGEELLLPLGDDDWEFVYEQIEHVNDRGIMVGRSLGRVLPRRKLGWIAFEPVGRAGEIRKIALEDLISEEEREAWDRLTPFEINNAGQIVGIGVRNGATFGFLMTPSLPLETVLEQATGTRVVAEVPTAEEVSRFATAGIPDVDMVVSAARTPEGLLPVGRFEPLLARRHSTDETDVDASVPARPWDPRSISESCASDGERCVWIPGAPVPPGSDDSDMEDSFRGRATSGSEVPSYDIVEIGTFGTPGSGAWSDALAINESGDVVGLADKDVKIIAPDGTYFRFEVHAFLYRDGELIDLGSLAPEAPYAVAWDINNGGRIAGRSMGWSEHPKLPTWFERPVVWGSDGSAVDPAAGGPAVSGGAAAINDLGQMALDLVHVDPPLEWTQRAHFWDPDHAVTEIRFPGAPDPGDPAAESHARDINNAGIVVGEAPRASGQLYAFKFDSVTGSIESPSQAFGPSSALGINEHGDVAGWEQVFAFSPSVGVVWTHDGNVVEFPYMVSPDTTYGWAVRVNGNGDVVGVDASWFSIPWVSFDALDQPSPLKIPLADLLSDEDRAEWELWDVRDINDAGQIVGVGIRDGNFRGFVMTPSAAGAQPPAEPGSKRSLPNSTDRPSSVFSGA